MQAILNRERAAIQICSELNRFVDLKNTLISIIAHVKNLSEVEAVGIRLHSNNDYHYYVYNGFPGSFIMMENFLCSKDKDGKCTISPDGSGYMLDCMCGNIIRGRTNSSFQLFARDMFNAIRSTYRSMQISFKLFNPDNFVINSFSGQVF
jgi:hypothetical protein